MKKKKVVKSRFFFLLFVHVCQSGNIVKYFYVDTIRKSTLHTRFKCFRHNINSVIDCARIFYSIGRVLTSWDSIHYNTTFAIIVIACERAIDFMMSYIRLVYKILYCQYRTHVYFELFINLATLSNLRKITCVAHVISFISYLITYCDVNTYY